MTTKSYTPMRNALEVTDQWLTRKELARAVGRSGHTLQRWELLALKQLIAEGVIEARREKSTGYGGTIWEYRRVSK